MHDSWFNSVKWRSIVPSQQSCRITVNRDAARRPKFLLGETPTQHADRQEPCFGGGYRVVRRVTDHHHFGGIHLAKPLQRCVENIRMRLRLLRIVSRCFHIDDAFDIGDLFVDFDFIALCRGCQSDLLAVGPYALEQLAY
jgi:hypothetical protein